MLRVLLPTLLLPAIAVLCWLALRPSLPRGDFVVASEQLRTLDPQRVSFFDEMQVAGTLFEGLTRLNPDTFQPEPAVAASWELAPDHLTYVFRIRPQARWSNGDVVTAEHFRWSWLRLLDPAVEAQYASLLFVVAGAEAYYRSRLRGQPEAQRLPADAVGIDVLDPATLRVRLAAPCSYFIELAALPALAPVYPPLLERLAYRDGRVISATRHLWTRPEHMICNGAFVLERWRFKEGMWLRRNPHYWDIGRVHMETIEIYLTGDANAGLVAYETGRVDLLRALDAGVARRLEDQRLAGVRNDVHISDRFATFFLRINCRRAPLDDPDLRRALSLAIDREQICEHVLGVGESPALTYVPRTAIDSMLRTDAAGRTVRYEPPAGLGAELTQSRRLALARALLERSGALRRLSARPLEILIAPDPPQFRRVAESMQEMWQRDLGLRVELRVLESKVLSERIHRLDYDLARSNWFGDYLDPSSFLDMFTTVSGQNRTGWSSAPYDELIAAAAREPDDGERYRLLSRAEAILVDELPIIPLYFMRGNYVLRSDVTGLRDSLRGILPIQWARRESNPH
jgi:oligopeptide transport system substrate-binding protein